MTERGKRGVARGREELEVARVLAENGFGSQAVSRAYYAAFYAAEAALLALGETRSKHSGVISAFGRLVVAGGGLDTEIGDSLRSLFRRRGEADYGGRPVPTVEAESAIQDAERLVDAVEAWLARRRG